MIHLHAPSSYTVDRLLYSCFKGGFDAFESYFLKTSNSIYPVKSCCHSDSLTVREEGSLSLDVVNIS